MVLPGTDLVAVGWGFISLTALLVLNRLIVRCTRRRHKYNRPWLWFGLSDYFVIAALPFTVAQMALYMILYVNGDLSEEFHQTDEAWKYLKYYYLMNVIYYPPMYFIKFAMLTFFLEITPPNMIYVRRAIYVGLFASFAGLTLVMCHYLARCGKHIELNWNVELNDTCNKKRLGRVALSWHFVTDIYIYAIPFFIVSDIRSHSMTSRIFTFFMFLSGLILVLLALPNFLSLFDVFKGSEMWSYWISIFEQNFAIILACLPALRITLVRTFGHSTSPDSSRRGSSNNNKNISGNTNSSTGTNPKRKFRSSWFSSKYRGVLSTREVADGGEDGGYMPGGGDQAIALESIRLSAAQREQNYQREGGECSSQEPIIDRIISHRSSVDNESTKV